MDYNAIIYLAALVCLLLTWIYAILLRFKKIGDKKQAWLEAPAVFRYAKSFAGVLVLVACIRTLYEPFSIPSGSMLPTTRPGDFIIADKIIYGVRLPVLGAITQGSNPDRGDIIVFIPPHDDRRFVKRVIGIPGDKVRIENNQPWVNGIKIEHSFVGKDDKDHQYLIFKEHHYHVRAHQKGSVLSNTREILVPKNQYFVLGDNRDGSSDSRVWGFVDRNAVIGKVFFRWMHIDWQTNVLGVSFDSFGVIE